ncbi:MAG: adenylyl-sulfate kinase [Bacteroidota bacterium]
MTAPRNHIHPIYDRTVPQAEKEALLGQRGMVFWLTGLSGAGKSTLAVQTDRRLHTAGHLTKVLDGDNIRHRINANLGFSLAERQENIRRVAEIARLFREAGVITICSFICPTIEIRAMARDIIGPDYYREIHVSAGLATCEARDPKGLYRKARAGVIPDFTGIHSPYENPPHPDLRLETDKLTVEEASTRLVQYVVQEAIP